MIDSFSIQLVLFHEQFPILTLLIGLTFGLLIGSFINVVVHRLPSMMEREWREQAHEFLESQPEQKPSSEPYNLVFPNSHCPKCQHNIKPWENIPLFSYLFLGGKCSSCKTHISLRYPIVELLTGILTAVVVSHFGLTLTSLACCALTWSLVCLSLIDYDTQLLPDNITLPLLWLGLIVNSFDLVAHFEYAFWGAIGGYLSLWSVNTVFRLVRGYDGMGYGDFKLLAVLGAWMGWQALPLIIILSSFAGAVIGGSLIAFGRDKTKPIPFGPYLAIAGWISLMWGAEITMSYLQFVAL
jgi:leader peptidase (prepilin peptidase)/N-methyltransferase